MAGIKRSGQTARRASAQAVPPDTDKRRYRRLFFSVCSLDNLYVDQAIAEMSFFTQRL